jgi:hypothetical protein
MLIMDRTAGRVQQCHAHADQCRAWAYLSRDKAAATEFLKLAQQWNALAIEIAATKPPALVATARGWLPQS